ncbi:unnamed protein product [Symbiodinium natans]|uniref:Uncharacterized protein n=1 Tax=Symbiodinium natans TaxID=878477 RepID=A0A812Q787_9DINO|nr:unnamed protein product [Symbiodinium natans]
MTYASILQGQLQHWLRGDFLGPLMRKIRDLTGQVHSSLVEVVGELEAVRAGAKEDLKVPELEARRREGDRRQRTGKDRSELKMEESIQAILLHLEKEMMLLANISAPRGELSLLLRAQQDLSALAAARPFSFDDLCGKTVPQPAPGGRKNSKSSAAGEPEPVSYFRIQEGLEAPVRAARSLVRLVTIQWNTYIAKWESLIRRYQEARNGYLEFQQKCAETARQKLLKDLRERPYLFQDLLEKSQAKWRQVEKEFHQAHVQPICDRYRDLANGVADLSTELLQQKKTTHAMKQDQALNFVQSLAEGSNEELLDKYRQELQAETQRSEELDRQIAAEKERNRIIWEQQMRPMLSNVAQASRLVQDLDGEEAVVARTSLSVEQVVRSEQLVEVMSFADRALRSRGYQAALAPRKLLRLIEALLWPDGAWKDPEEEARKAAEKTARKAQRGFCGQRPRHEQSQSQARPAAEARGTQRTPDERAAS